MAKSSGRLPKIASPDFAMTCEHASGSHVKFRAADAKQDAGHRQHRDRQHHALADFLEEREGILENMADLSASVIRRTERRGLLRPCAQSETLAAASSRQSAWSGGGSAALTVGIAGRLTLSSSTPRPTRIGTACGIAGDAAADADEPAVRVRALDGLRDQPQHRGIQRIDLRRELRMPAIHGERVLGQVVGADREEVGLARRRRPPSPRRRGLPP